MKNTYNNEDSAQKIFNEKLSEEEMIEIGEYFSIYRTSKSILKNQKHKNVALCVKKENLMYFNNNNIELYPIEIVVPLYELKEKEAQLYTQLYESSYSLSQLYDILSLTQIYNSTNKHLITN
jgi:hypothetical protein